MAKQTRILQIINGRLVEIPLRARDYPAPPDGIEGGQGRNWLWYQIRRGGFERGLHFALTQIRLLAAGDKAAGLAHAIFDVGARVPDRSAQAVPRDLARSIMRDELEKTLEWAGMDPRHAWDDDDDGGGEVEVDAALWDACATAAAKDGAADVLAWLVQLAAEEIESRRPDGTRPGETADNR